MNIPAADAFSLNSHSHAHKNTSSSPSRHTISMSTRRALTRSPSPSVIFSSSLSTNDGSKKATRRIKASSPDKLTNGHSYANGVNGHLHNVGEDVNGEAEPELDASCNDKVAMTSEKKKIDWEIPRKLLHSSIGFFVIPLYTSHTSPPRVVQVLSVAGAFISAVDFVRLRSSRFAAIYEKMLGFLMRESEKHKTNGVIWYLLGCVTVLSLYPLDIAVISILILSWCDTTASVFGRMYGPRTPPLPSSFRIPLTNTHIPLPFARRKSLAGFLAAAATGAIIAFGFWTVLAPLGERPPSLPFSASHTPSFFAKLGLVSLLTGFISAFAEAIDIGSLDDNLTLPILSGGGIWAVFGFISRILG